ncbi:hypothetical protein T10_10874 [Trichinella papuae]|uniref:Uncharacterized protein n=1 Tax=Trichinella papuae TaxID=268474 RepID=A0A0V1MRC1_9BILA|nr:hypothetical protein T10_10874 [Trichinella papuae]
MCLMSSSKDTDIWVEIVRHEINSSDGISKFIFDPGVHRPLFDPLDCPIVPKGSISTTLATPALEDKIGYSLMANFCSVVNLCS